MPGNTYYWNSAEFGSDESITNTLQRTSYVDPWDLENYAYIRDHLDSLEINSETSSFGEPVEASSFYYAPVKNEKHPISDSKNFDSLIESEYGTAKYAEIEEIYDEETQHKEIMESRKELEGLYGVTGLGLNYVEEGPKNKRSSSTTAHDHVTTPRIPIRRRMSYSFGDHEQTYNPSQSVYHSSENKQKLKPAPIFEERFQPNNFGLSNYGHLKIDYSCSWDNLNKYISH